MLDINQQEQLLHYFFNTLHPELAFDVHNVSKIEEFIREKTKGMAYANRQALDWAVSELSSQGQLHFYAGADISQQLQMGEAARHELAEKQAAEKDQRKRDELRNRLISAQEASFPGAASAYRGKEIVEQDQARQAAEQVKTAQRSIRHDAFIQELRAANQFLVTLPSGMVKWGSTNSERARLKNEIRQRYPEFKSEIN